MRIKSERSFWSGLIFLAIGVAFVILARDYRMGTAARMGPSYFPTLVGGLLALMGLAIAASAFAVRRDTVPRLHLRPLAFILLGIVVFGLALQPLGFLAAVALLSLVAGFADPALRWRESLALAAFLAVFSVGIFVVLLGLPLALWPSL